MSNVGAKSGQQSIASSSNTPENFDFDSWASQVKRQMIASLRRRGAI